MNRRLTMATAAVALMAAILPAVGSAAKQGSTASTDASVVPADRGAFGPTGSFPEGRWADSATTLDDGRVMVLGLSGGLKAELWDPATGVFTESGSLPVSHEAHSATLLGDGRVLVAGSWRGSYSEGTIADAAVWDPETQTFTPTGSMSVPRAGHLATLLDDGRVFVIGGTDDATPSAEVWDPTSGTFTAFVAGSGLGQAQALVPLDGGRVVAFGPSGSCGTGGTCSAIAEIRDIDADTVSAAGSMPPMEDPHMGCGVSTATPLLDGRILVTTCDYAGLAAAFLWDPTTGTFTPAGTLHHAGYGFSATPLLDGRVLVVGGADRSQDGVADAEIWDPATQGFAPTGSMGQSRVGASAALLKDGRVLVTGGGFQEGDGGGYSWSALSSAEVFELVP